MGIRSNVAGSQFARFQRRVNDRYSEHLDDVMSDVEDVMQDGSTEMRKLISERGVHNTVPNTDGRGTGAMENEVDFEVRKYGDVIEGRFGWLTGKSTRKRLKIFGWQESGTLEHGEPSGDPDPRKGLGGAGGGPRGIRPMLALADAEAHAREELAQRFRGRRG